MTHHAIDIRIYYEDTDAGGVVYHANYLNFAERGRTEFLRHIGHQNSDLAKEFGTIFVVKHIEIEYVRPAFLDDLLALNTRIEEMRNSSFKMRQSVMRGEEIVADMHVALVSVDVNTLKPVRIPDVLRHAFQKFIV